MKLFYCSDFVIIAVYIVLHFQTSAFIQLQLVSNLNEAALAVLYCDSLFFYSTGLKCIIIVSSHS